MTGIIGFISCLLCAIPFFIISVFGKGSSTPISFWSGDESLKDKVVNITLYNSRMAKMYQYYGIGFLLAGLLCVIFWAAGIAAVVFMCTIGIYLLYKNYKKILAECLNKD